MARSVRRRRTEVTVATHRVLSVLGQPPPARAWCEQCRREVPWVTPDEAASLVQVKARAIYRRVEAGGLHFVEDGAGAVWICINSL
jgi:hypothetical protein